MAHPLPYGVRYQRGLDGNRPHASGPRTGTLQTYELSSI
jgi:hypothetical protein